MENQAEHFCINPQMSDCHVAGIRLVTKENLRYFHAPNDLAIQLDCCSLSVKQ